MVEDIVFVIIFNIYNKIPLAIFKALPIANEEYIIIEIISIESEKYYIPKIIVGSIIIKETNNEYSIMHRGNKIYSGCENLYICLTEKILDFN